MFEQLRRAFPARRANARAEVLQPVEIPSLPPVPGAAAGERLAAADGALVEMVARLGPGFDGGISDGFDGLIDSWGVRWVSDDDRECATYVSELEHRLGRVEAQLAAVELTHRRCERGWTLADRDYGAARSRLGATDPDPAPLADDADETADPRPTGRPHASSPFGRFDPPRSTA